jgi:polyhydroxyalkanoate synthesis regulator phasin
MQKRWIVPGLVAAALIGIGGFGTLNAYAQTDDQSTVPPIIQKLVEKFGLKQTEVQQVFQEVKDEQMAAMETKFTEQLDKLVTDGKLTEAQKQAIITKRQELQTTMQAQIPKGQPKDFKSMTDAQRKAKMKARKTEMEAQKTALEAWAKTNGIDSQYLRFVMGMGKGFEFGRHEGGFGGPRPDDAEDNISTPPEL